VPSSLLPTDDKPATMTNHRIKVEIRSNNRNGKNLLANALFNFDWRPLEAIDDVDLKVAYFNNSITTLLDTFLPVYSVSRHTNDKPWITDEFRRLIRCRQHAWTSGNRTLYNQLRNQVNRLSKQLRQHYYNKKLQNLRMCDSHHWWHEIKKLTGQTTRPELSSLANDVAGGDAQLLADLVNESLQQVSCDLRPLAPAYSADTVDAGTEYCIISYEVFNKLSHINIYKSPGPDLTPNWFLRDFAFAVSEPICHIFNSSIASGTMLRLWKKSHVVPVPKTRPPKSIQNDLRPISLTPTVSKVLESLVGRWIIFPTALTFGTLHTRCTSYQHTLRASVLHCWTNTACKTFVVGSAHREQNHFRPRQ
jgi:hypothetical protein